ncbi:MAG TPA: serine hydrolase domain-containing protein [Dehalococcoidia bacterium]
MDEPLVAELEQTILDQMERDELTGLTIALVRDDAIAWSNGYGAKHVESGEPLATDTPFSVQSVTKTLIATALMQLHDQGHFDLDDLANQHLAPVLIENQWDAERPVTIRHLLTHTSGLPVMNFGGQGGKLPLDEYVAATARCERPPGEAIIYANTGFDAAGVLIERFSGQPVDDYLQTHIFGPLAMHSTALANPTEGTSYASGHFRSFIDGKVRPLPLPDWASEPPSPSGACWSTVEDLSRFLIAHLNGGAPILSPGTTAEMHRLHAAQGASRSGMGLGFRVTYSNGQRMICHGGDGNGFTAFVAGYPDEGVGAALLINSAGAQTARSVIGNTALALLAGKPPARHLASAPLAPGMYRSTYWDIEAEARNDDSPVLTCTEGLVVRDDPTESQLLATPDGRLEGSGGMFHGFEVELDGTNPQQITGGLYPFTFVRQGDISEHAGKVDENAVLTGTWIGTSRTPLGPLAARLAIQSGGAATVTTPLSGERQLDHLRAQSGLVSGEFSLTVPGVGEHRCFVRLTAVGGMLAGKIYARGPFGEAAMPTELERQ